MRALRLAALLVLIAACDKPNAQPEAPPVLVEPEPVELSPPLPKTQTTGPLVAPRIPSTPTAFSPSLVDLAEGEVYNREVHADVESCAECHGDIVREWRESVHGVASLNNPFYRVIFDEFFESSGPERIDFCAGCHDMVPMFEGTTKSILEPQNPDAHLGITCMTCHGMQAATHDGNASYVLSTLAGPKPNAEDPESIAAHRAYMALGEVKDGDRADSPGMCASCHRSFLTPDTGHDAAIAGINEVTPWRRSVYAGNQLTRLDDPIEAQNCVDCHMPRKEDGRRSHRFAGGHATLAAAIGSEEQLEAVRAMVEGAATISLGGWGSDPSKLEPPARIGSGQRILFDVVIFNEKVGHRFPGGAMDLRDTWVELILRDASGAVLVRSGVEYADGAETPTPHLLRSLLANADGAQVDNHRVHAFNTPVFNHTIDARDAAVVRYAWDAGEDIDLAKTPLKIELRLLQRRLMPALATSACEDLQTERGRDFQRFTKEYTGLTIDPCVTQPILEVSRASRTLTGRISSEQDWRHYFHYGMGLRHSVQEELDQAHRVLLHSVELANAAGDAAAVAQVEFMLGLVASRQNRTEDAMTHFQQAQLRTGPHPAIDYARATALARVFRHQEATQFYEEAARKTSDDRIYARWAISAASVFDHHPAYAAARAGLALEPRDPGLLRSQSLTLRNLDASPEWIAAAQKAFLDFKDDEAGARIRALCSDNSPDCLLERRPLHVHVLVAP